MPTLGYQKVNSDKFKGSKTRLNKNRICQTRFKIEYIHLLDR